MNQRPRIAVIGAGAVGSSLGADLISAGHDVTFIDQWAEHVQAMKRHGLTVNLMTETRNIQVTPRHLYEVAEIKGAFDIVFVGVKTYDTRWTVELIAPLLHETSVVVGLQNGMTIDVVAEVVGAHRSVGAVLGIAANMFEPGVVNRQFDSRETWLSVGTMDGTKTQQVERVAEILSDAGRIEIAPKIRDAKWMKLIANIPEMLPSAILGVPLLTAASVPGMRPVMDAAAKEAYYVARGLGITMLPVLGRTADEMPEGDEYAVMLLETILESYSRPDTRVAVLQDWDKGRRAELDAFSGYIVAKQAESGVSAPLNHMLLDIALDIEAGRLVPGLENAALMIEAFDRMQAQAQIV